MPETLISIKSLSKTYNDSFEALKNVNLEINKGEIFALLGPNGAGKTTMISIICGLVRPTSGEVKVNGSDIVSEYKITRSQIGYVPQELTLEQFETVFQNVSYTRGLYGKSSNPEHIEKILKDLSLWDKKSMRLGQLSGGMKRRVLIAKALSHEPSVLFLDEPTAGVDVELRQDMWRIVEKLRQSGVTIILTTHYIEEAEALAEELKVFSYVAMIVVDETNKLISRMGQKN
jgi:ABC-2 type transport system ATP-binding protein